MTTPVPIAKTTFLAARPSGDQFEITVEIGAPYRYGEGAEEWACSVALIGLYDQLRDQHGGDAFQAICLAIRLALNLLSGFQADGGKILFESGEEVPLDAYALRWTL